MSLRNHSHPQLAVGATPSITDSIQDSIKEVKFWIEGVLFK